MPRFFAKPGAHTVTLTGEQAAHIQKSLRMHPGEQLTVCDGGWDYLCSIRAFENGNVVCDILQRQQNETEPDLDVTLYYCLPKGDKLEFVIQKAVELGVSRIVPVLSSRCVSRPDEKSAAKKLTRYNKIALSACEQSGRGKCVPVLPTLPFAKAIEQLRDYDRSLFFYEGGGAPLQQAVTACRSLAMLIGPEGGFSPEEATAAQDAGAVPVTLGKRILRTETAPLVALTAVMLLTGNME